MSNPAAKMESARFFCGKLTKRAAVATISSGCRHVHATALGTDAGFQQTVAAVNSNQVPTYSWEVAQPSTRLLSESGERQAIIDEVTQGVGIRGKRFLRERVGAILEELMTNAIYHAYRRESGEERYSRRSRVVLPSQDRVRIHYGVSGQGVYLSVKDAAGTLSFETIAQSLCRCYESHEQIEKKESGAGLGTYMVFDACTHLKFDLSPGVFTEVSCWIADSKAFSPEYFSFNFFERG